MEKPVLEMTEHPEEALEESCVDIWDFKFLLGGKLIFFFLIGVM